MSLKTIILYQHINELYTKVTFVNQLLQTEIISPRSNVTLGGLVP